MNGTGSRSPSCSPLVRMKRIYGSGGSNSVNEEEQRQTETPAKAKITENDETDAPESERLHVAADLEGEGYSPSSAKSEESEEGEESESGALSRPEELLSPENLSGQIESPSLNEDSVGRESTSSSSEAVSTPKTTTNRSALACNAHVCERISLSTFSTCTCMCSECEIQWPGIEGISNSKCHPMYVHVVLTLKSQGSAPFHWFPKHWY